MIVGGFGFVIRYVNVIFLVEKYLNMEVLIGD